MDTITPDGFAAWAARRHGTAHPNQPRPLTEFRVRLSNAGQWWVEGNDGTMRPIPATTSISISAAMLYSASLGEWLPIDYAQTALRTRLLAYLTGLDTATY